MKFIAAPLISLALFPAALALTINTPSNVVECQPILLTWTDGQGPYYLSAIPGGQTGASPIKTFPTQNGNSLTWNVDLQAGTSLNLVLKDQTGEAVYSDIITVKSGSDRSCENTSLDVSGTSGPASTGANTGGNSTSATPTGSGGAQPSGATPASRPASVAASSTAKSAAPTRSNTASKPSVGTYGLAAAVGLIGLIVV